MIVKDFIISEWRQVKLAIYNNIITYPFSKQNSEEINAEEVERKET